MELTSVALIPLRGGSKSIPLKNVKSIAGKPLAYWTIKACLDSRSIEKVFVATDSEEIRQALCSINDPKLEFVSRSEESATDTASTEVVLLEFARKNNFENICLVQATSPLLESEDLDSGFELYAKNQFDSVLSVVEQKRFRWSLEKGYATPLNYEPRCRPRRQEFEGEYFENGAFYITSREALLKSRCRLSGKIGAYVMSEDTYFEIDEPSDWEIVEGLLKRRQGAGLKKKLEKIKLIATDVDGVLTDAGMYYSENGDELKKFNTRDGKGFELLRNKNFLTAIITSEDTAIVERRASKLKVDYLYQGIKEKKYSIIKQICEKENLSLEEVMFIGDDINDLEVLSNVGFACCPRDATSKNKSVSDYVCSAAGGEGCFREISDMLLASRGYNE